MKPQPSFTFGPSEDLGLQGNEFCIRQGSETILRGTYVVNGSKIQFQITDTYDFYANEYLSSLIYDKGPDLDYFATYNVEGKLNGTIRNGQLAIKGTLSFNMRYTTSGKLREAKGRYAFALKN